MTMKFGKILMALFLSAIVLTGCNSSGGITKKELGVVKVDDKDAIVHYGMTRSDAEKLLGKEKNAGKVLVSYENGIDVAYREDNVVAIFLKKESEGFYTTTSGARIGMLEYEIKNIYGAKDIISLPSTYTSYYNYSTETKKFLTQEELNELSGKLKPPESEKLYILNFNFSLDSPGKVEKIMLSDATFGYFGF